ncbi:phosphoadenylyl-sulfate reductase [Litchfieldia salsa]|uniref:Adenosine 5'-phosphosulfate reductase n=1 Tax=Litchfieldia salsa TaxID=930152 RepID=A0A1H0TGZ5_9BACI|nr:phosphoadenylyl-sulfate reductase [Litchfieldia salsa]SDP52816.1 phosphoadenylylsulfate reductase (thioredoxin) [Litchfieldia salsa]
MSELITFNTWQEEEVSNLNQSVKDYFQLLKWTYTTYGDEDVVYACSFGAEGMVLIDLIYKVKKDARIVFLDTGLHFKETYKLIDQVKSRYPKLKIELKKPNLTLLEQKNQYGDELWKSRPDLCCQIRKVEPLKEVLSDNLAWVSGLRKDQSPARKHLQFINKDEKFKLVKICPLIEWTWDDVWTYIHLNNLPYNELHDKNYPSIGCEPCTQPVFDDNLRGGRWSNHEKTECGLHLDK